MARAGNPVYLPASFKGVPFDAVSSSDEFGRRGDEYEYPLGEQTSFKDLGRKIRHFKLEGRHTGPAHVALTAAMVAACESPGPGMLMHPAHGPVMVVCVGLTTSFEYHDKKRYTQLQFEFTEANLSLAPFSLGGALGALLSVVSFAVTAALGSSSSGAAAWVNTPAVARASLAISTGLAALVKPIPDPEDEESFDVWDRLRRGLHSTHAYDSLPLVGECISDGTATIRAIHADALKRLKDFNSLTVALVNETPEIEPLGVAARLSLAGDYAVIAAQKDYATVADAIKDLDFVVTIYDEEQVIASRKADDVLASAIGAARASAASTILNNNISLPGVTTFDARGVWPSFVAAQNIYGDGERYAELEAYNPTSPTFFMARELVGLAR